MQGGFAPQQIAYQAKLQLYKQTLAEVEDPNNDIINQLTELAQQLHSVFANEVAQTLIEHILNVS